MAELNKQPITEPSQFRSRLIERWEHAWCQPLNRLTCSEVRLLLGQGDGLPWLARAVAEFVSTYPRAQIDFYPGDLTMAALRLFDQFNAADETVARQIAATELSWMLDRYTFDRSLRREAEELLAAVKA